jgi:hypothetical protein
MCEKYKWRSIDVVPWKRAVLDGLLAVLAPAVAVVEVVHLALGRERHARPTRLLLYLPLLLRFLLVPPARMNRSAQWGGDHA